MSYSFWRPPTLAPGGACPPLPLATPLVFGGLSSSTGKSILNNFDAVYLGDVCVQERRSAVV